jgi:hypothetical protein
LDIPLDFLPIGSIGRSEENAMTRKRPAEDGVEPADEGDAAAPDRMRIAFSIWSRGSDRSRGC